MPEHRDVSPGPYQSRWPGKDGGSEPGMLQQVVRSTVLTNGQELVCLLQEIQRLFHGEWTPAILVTLSDGPKRFKQIRDHVRSLDSRNDPEGRHRVTARLGSCQDLEGDDRQKPDRASAST